MKAKDTAMRNDFELKHKYCRPIVDSGLVGAHDEWNIEELLDTQAEVFFEAGIREVVKWVEGHNYHDKPQSYYTFGGLEWQTKLKEWRIE